MTRRKHKSLVPIEHITQSILIVRGQRVLLDSQIAALYGVTTKRLNEQVKRNYERFPEDFMFRLCAAEVEVLNRSQFATASEDAEPEAPNRSQSVTSSQKHRNPRFPPFAFTEHGAIMAATILNSPRELEARIARKLTTQDQAITGMLKTIRELMNPPLPKRRGIGFTANFDEP